MQAVLTNHNKSTDKHKLGFKLKTQVAMLYVEAFTIMYILANRIQWKCQIHTTTIHSIYCSDTVQQMVTVG